MNERWEYGEVAGEEGAGGSPAGSSIQGRGRAGTFPWPPPDEGPVLASFGETWRAATFEPSSFFSRVPRDGGTGAALLYYMVVVVLVAGATLFWDSLALFAGGLDESALATELGMEAVSPVVGFLLTPAVLLVMLFVATGITHALLAIFGDGRHGIGTTLRVFCYAYSPGLFGVVPVLGGLVGSIWMLVLLIVGLREAHETDVWRTALAVLLPFALLVGLIVMAFLVLVAAGAAILGA